MPEIMPWHMNQLRNPEFTRVDLVKEGANSQAHIVLFKNKGGVPMEFQEFIAKMNPEHAKIVTDEIEKAKADAIAAMQASLEEVTKAKTEAEEALAQANITKSAEGSEEDILKSVKDPAVRSFLEIQIAKTKAAEELIRKQAAEKLEVEAIAKAREVLATGASEEQLAGIYKSLNDKPEVREEVFGILKAASAVAAQGGTFTEVGKSTAGSESGSSADGAWAQIEKAAAEHVAKGMSQAQAISKAVQENPELYRQYVEAGQ